MGTVQKELGLRGAGILVGRPDGTILRQTQRPPARYWWSSTLDGSAQTATFWGQSSQSVTIPWSELRL